MKIRICFIIIVFLLAGAGQGISQDFENVQIQSISVADGIYMLTGRGGNMGLAIGEEATFLIDDQFAPLTPKIVAAVKQLTDQPIKFLVNTHWHGDHTGGNENLGRMGVLIFAHRNVRQRMSAGQFMEAFQRQVPPAPPEALPVVTFTEEITFHINGDDVQVFHIPHAHTDGDAVIWFKKANVIHTGDLYFSESYPFIDLGSGGSVDGLIKGVEKILAIANEQTAIIPGHGRLSDREGLQSYLTMLKTIRERIQKQIEQGKNLDQIIAGKPTADYDAQRQGWITPERFVEILYRGLTGK